MISITLHELGHYIPAKRFGLKVPEFSVGFGPRIYSKKVSDLNIVIRALPIGGFVRILGMYPPGKGGSNLAIKAREISREEVKNQKGTPYYKLTTGKKITVLAAGPLMNLFVAAIALLLAVSVLGLPSNTNKISKITQCEKVCLKTTTPLFENDKVVAVNNTSVKNWEEVLKEVSSRNDSSLLIERGESKLLVKVRKVEGAGIKLNPEQILERSEPSTVLSKIGILSASSFKAYLSIPKNLAEKLMQKSDQLPATGVIGSAKITQNIVENENSVQWKITLILLLIALINIALFVLNLLPIPPLDGGHIALALIDGSRKGLAKIRKKVTPPDLDTARTLPFAYGVALTFALLSIYIAIQDISKYT